MSYSCAGLNVTACNTGQAASYCSWCQGSCKKKSDCLPEITCLNPTMSGGNMVVIARCSGGTFDSSGSTEIKKSMYSSTGWNLRCTSSYGKSVTKNCTATKSLSTPTPTVKPTPAPTASPTVVCRLYMTDVSKMYCNDIYGGYITLKMGAEQKLKTGRYVNYYGCLNGSSSGKYNSYECKYAS